jgi:hypothetical protein
MLEDYKQTEDGRWEGPDGISHEDIESIFCSFLGFCGCGDPGMALKYVRDSLQLLHDLQYKVWEKQEAFESWDARVDAFFGTRQAKYFMWYRLDDLDLTEHGGSIPGWLTDKGEELLREIDENIDFTVEEI